MGEGVQDLGCCMDHKMMNMCNLLLLVGSWLMSTVSENIYPLSVAMIRTMSVSGLCIHLCMSLSEQKHTT